MSHPPIKREAHKTTTSIESYKNHMPTSLRTKFVGQGRKISDDNSQRETRTISFANKDQYEEMLLARSPELGPPEISIDERHEDDLGQNIPVLKN